MLIAVLIVIHLFVAIVITTIITYFNWFGGEEAASPRIAFGLFWEFTIPVTILIFLGIFFFKIVPKVLAEKAKAFVDAREEKKLKEAKEKAWLAKKMSEPILGESLSFRDKPKIRRYQDVIRKYQENKKGW